MEDIISDKLIDSDNIVSSDTFEIELSEKFLNEYGYTDFDKNIVRSAVLMERAMTEFQCRHFVSGSQVTPYKKTKQALMELEVRYHAYYEILTSLRKCQVQRKMFVRDIEKLDDELDKELLQVDLDKLDYDITIYKRRFKQCEVEINHFIKIIKEVVKTEEDLEYYSKQDDEDEEKVYWISRMGKQAAVDILSAGRIGSGNMDSILMMDTEDQLEVMHTAIKYSGMIQGGIERLNMELKDDFQQHIMSPELKIPSLQIGDNNGTKDIQHPSEPKIGGESI